YLSESVRLVDGDGFCSGRLEVKTHQSWSTMCETDFDRQDAEVVCRELGCGTPLTLQGALFGEGTHPFGTREFQCKGSEKSLVTCSISSREEHTCKHGSAVGLTCKGPRDVRLVDGGSRCAGTVEIFHSGEWRKVSEDYWSMNDVSVVCRQLNCGSALAAITRRSKKKQSGWNVGFYCRGSESELRKCISYNNELYQINAGISYLYSDLLEPPTTSFSTTIRVRRALQVFEVFRGHSFSITCSIESTYPGGFFHLKLPWTNRSHTQTAVNHSASFLFPAADDSHQGNYSCVYDNQVTFESELLVNETTWRAWNVTQNFSSESEPLSITVTGNLLFKTEEMITLLVKRFLIKLCVFQILRYLQSSSESCWYSFCCC
ncbi:deleted in malignant brain tumors 1 protein-like, partial [Astyanax mexicanus]